MKTLQMIGLLGLLSLNATGAEHNSTELLADDPLSGFRATKVWHGVSKATAVDGEKDFDLSGEGLLLVNITDQTKRAPYLFTNEEFSDVEVHLEFMIPKDSNAGIYLMGRYEIQILDSFGKKNVGAGDLGGLYQRWDPKRKATPGYDGVPPKTNASKPPGEWQSLDIVFRAPRFDSSGKKTENARFVAVRVNGVTVHEDEEAEGPTRAHPLKGEADKGPISIQGDHGPIAIRSFKVKPLELP